MAIYNIHTATASKFADTRAQARVGPGLVTLLPRTVKDWNNLEIENLNNIDLETFKNYLATL